MIQTLEMTKAITNLSQVHHQLDLNLTFDQGFFQESFDKLPELTNDEKEILNQLKTRYLYYMIDGFLKEKTISMITLSSLLKVGGISNSHFKIQNEGFVKIEIDNPYESNKILEGSIDALVVEDKFWIVLIETKSRGLKILHALPQTLSYMMGNSRAKAPVFAMITNGEDYIFVKLNRQLGKYALSNKFTLSNPMKNELYEVAQVMKRIISFIV